MQNSTHVVGIHKGMVLWAQGSKDWYPGLNADGTASTAAIPAEVQAFGTASRNGAEPVYRMAVLMRGNYFSAEYMLSPAETNRKKLEGAAKAGVDMTSDSFSYAMLRIDHRDSARHAEWRATQNSKAAVISDRNLGPGAGDEAYSNNTSPTDGWRGSICFNDNAAIFGVSQVLATSYYHAPRSALSSSTIDLDNLFADDNDSDGNSGNDAAMVHQDAVTYVNQK